MNKSNIEVLEEKIDNLTEMVKVLASITRDIYQTLEVPDELATQKIEKTNSGSKLHPKNRINWDDLLKATRDTNAESFVLSIYNSKYPTITDKQYHSLGNLAEQFEVRFLV